MTHPGFAVNRRIKNTACLLACSAFIFLTSVQTATAELKKVTAVGKAVISGNVSYDQAKAHALHQARGLAVEQAAGININSSSIIKDNLMLVDLVKTFSYGFLVEETIVDWRGSWLTDTDPAQPGYPILEVTLTGVVDVLPKSFFRNYNLTARLNKSLYTEGEPVTFKISAKEDMYVVIANYTSNNNIIPVFPNHYYPDNLVLAGKTLSLPRKGKRNMEITVGNYQGHTQDAEAFLIFGFPKNVRTSDIPWASVFVSGKEIAYADFFKTLLNLPVRWISENTLVYTVTNDKSLTGKH